MIQRDEYKKLCEKYEDLKKECEKLKAQLALWKGTAP